YHAIVFLNAIENYFSLLKSHRIDAHAMVILLIALKIDLDWNSLMRKSSRCLKNVLARTKFPHRVAWIRHGAGFHAIDRDRRAVIHSPGKTSRAINEHSSCAVAI